MRQRRIYAFAIAFLYVAPSFAQVSVADLESIWRSFYHKGYEFFDRKDYENAAVQFQKCVKLLKDNDAENSTYYIYALLKLGETYHDAEQFGKASSVTSEILDIRGKIKPGSKRFVEYLINLGVYYSNVGDYDSAIKYLTESLGYEDAIASIKNGKAAVYNRIALCLYCKGNILEAIESQQICVQSDVSQTPDYIKALAYYYYRAEDWSSLEAIIKTCYDYCREPILRKFTHSGSKDRAQYWSEAGLFFTKYIPTYAYKHPSSTLNGIAYDAALFGKGVLLAADNKAAELMLTSNDKELVERYSHYLELKRKKTRTLDEDFELQALSDVFLQYQKEHKNEFRSEFRIGWKDVQKRLGENDIAIEFITIPGDDGIDNYAALSLKKSDTAPKLTLLCDYEQISDISAEIIYTSAELYNLVWGKLEGEIEDVQNIYFSPTGAFYNTGIEYLPNEDGLNLSAMKNVYRLSSTKELVVAQSHKLKTISLFGGVDYDTPISDMAKESPEYEAAVNAGRAVSLDSLDLRGSTTGSGFKYLAGTMEEVGEISSILFDTDLETNVYSGNYGSEVSFKNMSGNDIDVLHIATHGFYYANRNSGRNASVDKLFLDLSLHFKSEDVVVVNEDKMLTRSGLVLAGANNVLRRMPIPEGVEDGVLYADEIASLNFSSVNLLIMSACQSGLGDTSTSEGVFGLQRGFKLAGVGSIIMSLWNVDDAATRILMTEMYKNLASGQSKRNAFNNAQIALRTNDNGAFDMPEYWAAFVLLDALD